MPAIAPHSTPTSKGPWDGQANESRLKPDQSKGYYEKCFAWYDAAGDPTKKGTYKFPHHEVSGDGAIGSANVKACVAIIGALNGGRGGAKIPEADRKGVHAHAAKHLKDAGENVPELKSERDYESALIAANLEMVRREARVERRTIPVIDLEVRDGDGEGGMPMICGHAAVFNQPADLGYFTERVAPGAFTRTIPEDDIRALVNHDENLLLGRSKPGRSNNTLALVEDSVGLAFRVVPPDTQMCRDLIVSMKRGDIDQCSFGFQRRAHTITQDAAGNITRTLTDVKLFDVSVVTYPAYTQTDASVRAARELADIFEEIRSGPDGADAADAEAWSWDLEHRLRELDLVRES